MSKESKSTSGIFTAKDLHKRGNNEGLETFDKKIPGDRRLALPEENVLAPDEICANGPIFPQLGSLDRGISFTDIGLDEGLEDWVLAWSTQNIATKKAFVKGNKDLCNALLVYRKKALGDSFDDLSSLVAIQTGGKIAQAKDLRSKSQVWKKEPAQGEDEAQKLLGFENLSRDLQTIVKNFHSKHDSSQQSSDFICDPEVTNFLCNHIPLFIELSHTRYKMFFEVIFGVDRMSKIYEFCEANSPMFATPPPSLRACRMIPQEMVLATKVPTSLDNKQDFQSKSFITHLVNEYKSSKEKLWSEIERIKLCAKVAYVFVSFVEAEKISLTKDARVISFSTDSIISFSKEIGIEPHDVIFNLPDLWTELQKIKAEEGVALSRHPSLTIQEVITYANSLGYGLKRLKKLWSMYEDSLGRVDNILESLEVSGEYNEVFYEIAKVRAIKFICGQGRVPSDHSWIGSLSKSQVLAAKGMAVSMFCGHDIEPPFLGGHKEPYVIMVNERSLDATPINLAEVPTGSSTPVNPDSFACERAQAILEEEVRIDGLPTASLEGHSKLLGDMNDGPVDLSSGMYYAPEFYE